MRTVLTLPCPEKQREFAQTVVSKLRDHGFEAYWAGGCVRDALLGKTPTDYDVATNALPEQVRQVFTRQRTVAVGAQFGVISVLPPRKEAGCVEVATFRQDVQYTDGRHPDAVMFSTPEEDAQRRDFTVNGLFYDPLEQRVIDFVGGRADLENRIVRAIGDPHARFREDKLRLLRAVRFTATLDFSLDPTTRDAVEQMSGEIHVVSVERIVEEMRRMLHSPRRASAVALLRDVHLLEQILPEVGQRIELGNKVELGQEVDFASPAECDSSVSRALAASVETRWQATLASLSDLETGPTFALTLATLLARYLDGGAALRLARRWKLSNHDSKRLSWLIEQQSALAGAKQMAWSRLQPLLVNDGGKELVALHTVLAKHSLPEERVADAEDLAHCRNCLGRPSEELSPLPLLTGNDLMELGVPCGPIYQHFLQSVRDAQLDGLIASRDDAIRWAERLSRGES